VNNNAEDILNAVEMNQNLPLRVLGCESNPGPILKVAGTPDPITKLRHTPAAINTITNYKSAPHGFIFFVKSTPHVTKILGK
jgi:hypothetical protein